MKDILIIPNVKIHNANALSSPYTIGFPAMTAWLGFMHALERRLGNTAFHAVGLHGLVVSCIDLDMKTYKGNDDYIHSLVATANPLGKDGKRTSFIEEARCDLEVTLAIECDLGAIDYIAFTDCVDNLLHTMKIASGDIISFKPSEHLEVDPVDPRPLNRKLMPGFCLVSRQDLMKDAMEKGLDAIDALLEYLKVTTDVEISEGGKVNKSKPYRKESGWIVPVPMGYQGISDLGQMKNARDSTTPHRFAESIVSLGEFVMPYHFESLDEMIWRYKSYEGDDLYLCENNYKKESKECLL